MSKQIYRNGKLITVSDAEWRKTVQANRDKRAAREAEVTKVETKGSKAVVTTADGKTHRVGGIGSIGHMVGNLIVGGDGPIHTGNGDVYVNGVKQPKKPKRNPRF